MYNQSVGPAAATGIGSAALYSQTGWELLLAMFVFMAIFTIIGAIQAVGRTLPAVNLPSRKPRQLAPSRRLRP